MSHIVVRYKNKKNRLEICCNKKHISDYKKLKTSSDKLNFLNKLLIIDEIFSDYKKGVIASSSEIYSICKSKNKNDIILFILDNGEFPLTTSERRKIIKQKRLEFINYIHRNYLNPMNKKPYSTSTIDTSLKSIKGFVIDLHKPIELQVQNYKKKIIKKLPLMKNSMIISIDLTYSQMGSCLPLIKKYAKILKEEYNKEGLSLEIETNPNDYEHIIKIMSYEK